MHNDIIIKQGTKVFLSTFSATVNGNGSNGKFIVVEDFGFWILVMKACFKNKDSKKEKEHELIHKSIVSLREGK